MMTPRILDALSSRCALLLLTAAVATGTASAQSLGELARKEEARRKAIQSSGKVYTNESVRSEPSSRLGGSATAPAPAGGATAPAAGTPPAAAAGQEPEAKPAAPEAAKDQAYWKQRIDAARDALSRSQTFADALQTRINALTADFTARDDPAQRAVVAADRQKALAELDRVQQDIKQQTKAIADIQEEARRANVPPGWLR